MSSLVEIGPVVLEEILKFRQLEITNSLHPRCFMLSLFEIGPLVLEKKVFKFRQCVFAILLSPLGKGRGPSTEHT